MTAKAALETPAGGPGSGNAAPQGVAASDRVIAMASGKGGVGKTVMSISLCQSLAKAGKKVVLFDGDLGLANVDVQLGLVPGRDIGAVIAGKVSMKQAVNHYEAGGFDILAGRSGTASLSALPAQRLSLLREEIIGVAGGYDHVVLDLGAGVDRTVRMLASAARTVIVVTTDEPTALTDAYAFIKLAQAAGQGASLRILVNQASSKAEGERTYATLLKACQNFLKIEPPLAGIVRRDTKVADTIRHQTPLLTRHPTCNAAQDVDNVAAGLLA